VELNEQCFFQKAGLSVGDGILHVNWEGIALPLLLVGNDTWVENELEN
jgi:hypothetical protein